jgi:folate-dependent phosphoribosylglycinamide formyltransferase PurN
MAHQVVVLAVDSLWTRVVVNALRRRFGDVPLVLEDKEPIALFLRRRMRKLGVIPVMGQLAFIVFARALRPLYSRREQDFLDQEGFDATSIDSGLIRVRSVNDARTIELLRSLEPKVIVVFQTRILARRLLESIPAVFINVHNGITPQYRGLHGAYWALAGGDLQNCGVTVHRIDAGVDTGPIIAQSRITPPPSASYFTYHWYQLAAALPLLVKAIEDASSGQLVTFDSRADMSSRQYYHPTLWGYLRTGLRRNVW